MDPAARFALVSYSWIVNELFNFSSNLLRENFTHARLLSAEFVRTCR